MLVLDSVIAIRKLCFHSKVKRALFFLFSEKAGKVAGNNSVGRELMDLVTSVPRMSKEDFESILNSNMQVMIYLLYSACGCIMYVTKVMKRVFLRLFLNRKSD